MFARQSVVVILLVWAAWLPSDFLLGVTCAQSDGVYFSDDITYDNDANPSATSTTASQHIAGPDAAPNSGRIKFEEGPPFIEGDSCTDAERHWNGICTLASRCPAVLQAYKQSGRRPTVCSYKEIELVVCCPVDRPPIPTRAPEVIVSSTSRFDATPVGQQAGIDQFFEQRRPLPSLVAKRLPQFSPPRSVQSDRRYSGQRLSQQKCDEYTRLATHTATFTQLSVITSVDKVDIPTCVYPTGLIVGGIKTKAGEFPHMAVLGWTDSDTNTVNWQCGASLISERFVLTAGHCGAIRGVRPDIVRLGEQNLARNDDQAHDYGVADVFMHPGYKSASHYFDIAVVKLAEPVRFTLAIRPACLWPNKVVNATSAVATGWGQVEFSGSKSDDLLKVSLDLIDQVACRAMYAPSKRLRQGLNDDQFCAGVLSGGQDTCQGDSGGPLQVVTPKNQCIFHIVGVTSFGRACAARNTAGVYTRVSAYLDWLEPIVWGGSRRE